MQASKVCHDPRHHPVHTHANSAAGQCLSVNAFEKLNQLGEGSRFGLGFEPQ